MTTTTKISPTTKEINPLEFLSELANSQSSGYLTLNQGLVSWNIYLHNGNISYADCSVQLIDQLQYYLQSLGYQKAVAGCRTFSASRSINQFTDTKPEHESELYSQAISWLLQEKYLDLTEGLKVLEKAISDTLESCLWLKNSSYTWQEEFSLPEWINEQFHNYPQVNLKESLKGLKTRLEEWQKCSQEISSVHQRPYFSSGWEKRPLPLNGSLDIQVLKELSNVLRGRTSIRQLSVLLKKDELNVAKILSPYIADKILYLRGAASPLDKLPEINQVSEQDNSSPLELGAKLKEKNSPNNQKIKTKKIVCIDDSPTILNEIQRFLDRDTFSVTAIDDPIKAASIVFRIKPDLILMDITMPKINGYKLCGLLRASAYCNKTPIIMVTGNTGFIDKARAKLAGATDYFTKPFTKEGLMNIVEKHLK